MIDSIENSIFEKQDYTKVPLKKGAYDNCKFINCSFLNSDLSNVNFTTCEFQDCDWSNTNIKHTVLNEVCFSNCKLLGLQFDHCSDFLFSVEFIKCNLSFSSFYNLRAKKTSFKDCILHQVDFTTAELSSSVFDNCDFKSATFERTILEKVDFRSSYNYIIDPEMNTVKKAKFSMPEVLGLLRKYNIEVK
jgi:uncharacterized protein YjbI with pentapeptide repeats